jgi:fructose-bisphosphate aldolase class II
MTTAAAGGLVREASGRGAGIAAFNVITLEHAEAVVTAAEAVQEPVILQVSENVVKYRSGALTPMTAALKAMADAADVPVALHLDHVEDTTLIRRAAAAGFGSIMIDAGRLPYADNLATTATATAELHSLGIFVEAELGYVGGKASQVVSAHTPGVRTDPGQAAAFVETTGVDSLAVAVGSSHAMTDRTAQLDVRLIAALREALPVPLVLHGSSGVPDDGLRAAVRAGITKVNVGTALNVAFTAAVRRELAATAGVDPRGYLAAARDDTAAVARHLIEVVSRP